jgi:hypothetical protein
MFAAHVLTITDGQDTQGTRWARACRHNCRSVVAIPEVQVAAVEPVIDPAPARLIGDGPSAQEIVLEKPRYGLSWFRISFGRLQLKAYTKGEHVLRFEATVHNAKELRCRRSLDNSGQIITRLAGMAGRFAVALDCADTGFLPDGILDQLPLPAQAGAGERGPPYLDRHPQGDGRVGPVMGR